MRPAAARKTPQAVLVQGPPKQVVFYPGVIDLLI